METRVILCDGFHGQSCMSVEDRRVESDGFGGKAVWLSQTEMYENRPCGVKGCTCGDSFTILETEDGGFGRCLVAVR